jgi:hypothetical protein
MRILSLFVLFASTTTAACGSDTTPPRPDGAASDAATIDAARLDAAMVDGSSRDAAPSDASAEADSGADASAADAGGVDASSLDDASSDDAAASDDAQASDGGGPPVDWASCGQPSDCTLVPDGCCWSCAPPTLEQMDAVNVAESALAAHYAAVCAEPTPACPRCATQPNANLIATCEIDRCAGYDVTTLPLSECGADSDCVVRYASCCGCSGEDWEVVAIRRDMHAGLDAMLCDASSCTDDCVPIEDPDFVAFCDPATSHCAIRR